MENQHPHPLEPKLRIHSEDPAGEGFHACPPLPFCYVNGTQHPSTANIPLLQTMLLKQCVEGVMGQRLSWDHTGLQVKSWLSQPTLLHLIISVFLCSLPSLMGEAHKLVIGSLSGPWWSEEGPPLP